MEHDGHDMLTRDGAMRWNRHVVTGGGDAMRWNKRVPAMRCDAILERIPAMRDGAMRCDAMRGDGMHGTSEEL